VPILADRKSMVSFPRAPTNEFYRSNGHYKKFGSQELKYYIKRKDTIYAGLLVL
jgi:hypothetical protein